MYMYVLANRTLVQRFRKVNDTQRRVHFSNTDQYPVVLKNTHTQTEKHFPKSITYCTPKQNAGAFHRRQFVPLAPTLSRCHGCLEGWTAKPGARSSRTAKNVLGWCRDGSLPRPSRNGGPEAKLPTKIYILVLRMYKIMHSGAF